MTGEPSSTAGDGDRERQRAAGVFGAYRADRRKRRAWAAGNPGNAAIRAELERAFWNAGERGLSGGFEGGGGAILDAGCGTGWWLSALIERGVAPARLHGVDVLPARVAAAGARIAAAAHRVGVAGEVVDVRAADVRELPHPDASFDLVVLSVVLSSLSSHADVRTALIEAKRVTRPGGIVLVYEPRRRTPNSRTLHVPPRLVGEILGSVAVEPITVWPPLARRLGRLTGRLYPLLSRLRPATSHALTAYRR